MGTMGTVLVVTAYQKDHENRPHSSQSSRIKGERTRWKEDRSLGLNIQH
jgi:hypothetical protein